MGLDLAQQRALRLKANDALDRLAILKEQQRWDAEDAISRRRTLVLIDVQLADGQLAI